MHPSRTIYLHARADFDEDLRRERSHFGRHSLGRALWEVLSDAPDVLEVPEPMWLRFVPHTLAVCLVGRASAALRGRRCVIVTYAIENATLDRRPTRFQSLPTAIWRATMRVLVSSVTHFIDFAVFGTNGAREAYKQAIGASAFGALAQRSTLILALPSTCDCPSDFTVGAHTVLFVGAFDERKGVEVLLSAWPLVTARQPSATLLLIGDGDLRTRVAGASHLDNSISYLLNPARHLVHKAYRQAKVVVLASQPQARWREQVGLPLVEGLAHGCRVISTTESGLADWLRENGYSVLDAPTQPIDIADAICAELEGLAAAPTSPLGSDGRIDADRWLMEQATTALSHG